MENILENPYIREQRSDLSVFEEKDSLVKRIHIDNTAEELKRLDAAKERTMTQLGQLYEKALQEVGEVNAAISRCIR